MNILEGRIIGVKFVKPDKVEYAFQAERLVEVDGSMKCIHEFLQEMNKDDDKRFPLLRFESPLTGTSALAMGYSLMERKELVRIHVAEDLRECSDAESPSSPIDWFSIGEEFDKIKFAVSKHDMANKENE